MDGLTRNANSPGSECYRAIPGPRSSQKLSSGRSGRRPGTNSNLRLDFALRSVLKDRNILARFVGSELELGIGQGGLGEPSGDVE